MIEPQSAQDGESAETENATFVPPPRSIGAGLKPSLLPFAVWPLERTGRSVPPAGVSAGGGSAETAVVLGPPASPVVLASVLLALPSKPSVVGVEGASLAATARVSEVGESASEAEAVEAPKAPAEAA